MALIKGIGIAKFSGGGNGGGASSVQRQEFTAINGQTTFTATQMTLNDEVSVFLEGALQKESMYNRSNDDIVFVIGLKEGMEVVLLN